MPIRSYEVYRNHDADDDHAGAQQNPQSQPLFDEIARTHAVAVQQERQHEEAAGARNDRKDDEQPKIVAGKAGGDGHDLIGDRGQPLEQDDPGTPLRISGAEGLDLVAIAVELDQPAADRVIEQRAAY